MTPKQYKKIIEALSKEELEDHFLNLFKTSEVFRDIESSCWDEASNRKLLETFRSRLENVFWKSRFNLEECKLVLNDCLSRTTDPSTKALIHLAYASEATSLSASYGDFGDRYYNSLESSAEQFMNYAKKDPEFFCLHEAAFEQLVVTADPIGQGIAHDLSLMLEEGRIELGYYDNEDE